MNEACSTCGLSRPPRTRWIYINDGANPLGDRRPEDGPFCLACAAKIIVLARRWADACGMDDYKTQDAANQNLFDAVASIARKAG